MHMLGAQTDNPGDVGGDAKHHKSSGRTSKNWQSNQGQFDRCSTKIPTAAARSTTPNPHAMKIPKKPRPAASRTRLRVSKPDSMDIESPVIVTVARGRPSKGKDGSTTDSQGASPSKSKSGTGTNTQLVAGDVKGAGLTKRMADDPRWTVTKTRACKAEPSHGHVPTSDLTPPVWASSREELLAALPELSKLTHGVAWVNTEVPMLLLDDRDMGLAVSDVISNGLFSMELKMARDFVCLPSHLLPQASDNSALSSQVSAADIEPRGHLLLSTQVSDSQKIQNHKLQQEVYVSKPSTALKQENILDFSSLYTIDPVAPDEGPSTMSLEGQEPRCDVNAEEGGIPEREIQPIPKATVVVLEVDLPTDEVGMSGAGASPHPPSPPSPQPSLKRPGGDTHIEPGPSEAKRIKLDPVQLEFSPPIPPPAPDEAMLVSIAPAQEPSSISGKGSVKQKRKNNRASASTSTRKSKQASPAHTTLRISSTSIGPPSMFKRLPPNVNFRKKVKAEPQECEVSQSVDRHQDEEEVIQFMAESAASKCDITHGLPVLKINTVEPPSVPIIMEEPKKRCLFDPVNRLDSDIIRDDHMAKVTSIEEANDTPLSVSKPVDEEEDIHLTFSKPGRPSVVAKKEETHQALFPVSRDEEEDIHLTFPKISRPALPSVVAKDEIHHAPPRDEEEDIPKFNRPPPPPPVTHDEQEKLREEEQSTSPKLMDVSLDVPVAVTPAVITPHEIDDDTPISIPSPHSTSFVLNSPIEDPPGADPNAQAVFQTLPAPVSSTGTSQPMFSPFGDPTHHRPNIKDEEEDTSTQFNNHHNTVPAVIPHRTFPSMLPPEVEVLIDAYVSGRAVVAIASNDVLRRRWNIVLPPEYGYVFLGFFRVRRVWETQTAETQALDAHLSGQLEWRFRCDWGAGDDDVIDSQVSNTVLQPWWAGPRRKDKGKGRANDNVEDIIGMDIDTDTDSESTTQYRRQREHHPNYRHRNTPLNRQHKNVLPTHIKSPSTLIMPDEVFPLGWFCEQCGKVNHRAMLRHRTCASSVCKTNPKPPSEPASYALSLNQVRDPQQGSPISHPYDTYPPGVEAHVAVWDDGMRTYTYVVPGTKGDGVTVKHIFTCNNADLQLEATKLLELFQLDVPLERKVGKASNPYFECTIGPPPRSGKSSDTDKMTWGNAPPCAKWAKETLLYHSQGYGEMRGLDINKVSVLAWVTSGRRKSPSSFQCKNNSVIVMCLGADTVISLTPKSGFPAPGLGGCSVDLGSMQVDDKSVLVHGDMNFNYEDEHMEDEDLNAMAELLPTAPKISSTVHKTARASANPPKPTMSTTLVHGDAIILSGDEFEYAIGRSGTSILLIGSYITL